MKKRRSWQSILITLFMTAAGLFSFQLRVDAYSYVTCIPPFGACDVGCKGIACFIPVNQTNAYDTTIKENLTLEHETGAPEPDPRPQNNPNCTGDPIYLHSGQFYYQCHDLSIPGRKLDLEIGHTYFSGLSFNGQFGYGWLLNYYMRLHKARGGDVVIISGDGRKTRYTLSGSDYLPPAGRFEELVKNGDNTWTLTKAQGEKYEFDMTGKLVEIKDRNGNTITLEYGGSLQAHSGFSPYAQDPEAKIAIGKDFRLSKITDTTGREIDFAYNADGLLEAITDGAREVSFDYDPDTHDLLTVTKPTTSQFPSGVTKTFIYDTEHNVVQIKDFKNQIFVDNTYDAQGRVEEQVLGGTSIYLDYSVANKVTETDRNGTDIEYTFDANGLMTQKKVFTKGLRAGEPASFTNVYTYNNDFLKLTEKFPKGNGVKYTYDSGNGERRARGNLLEIRRKTDITAGDNDTNDIVTDMTYEAQFNQIKTLIDPEGNTTIYTYDYELGGGYGTVGDLIFIHQPATVAGTAITEFDYNAYGQVVEVTDPNGNVTQFTYNGTTGYLESIIQDPSGINAVTEFTYDAFGNLDEVTDANNNTTDYDYDALGWLNQVTNPLGYLTKYTYDANGNVTKIERQADTGNPITWQTTEFTYDILNNLLTVEDPLDRVTTYTYDDNENLETVEDAEENVTTYVWDERNLLFTVTDANSPAGVTRYDYDTNGNLAKIIDAEGNDTLYTFDLFDRLQKTTYEDTLFDEYVYDKNSNVIEHILPSTDSIEYVYDEMNRILEKNFPATSSLDTTYTYDVGSRMLTASNNASSNSFTYDDLNRVLTNMQTFNSNVNTVTYDYDDVGNRIEIVYPSTKDVDYSYDDNNRLNIVTLNGSSFVDYDYDPLDRRTQKSFLSSTRPKATYAYDIANQLESITNKLVNNTAISVYAYPDYDDVGNRLELEQTYQSNPAQTINYAYNDIYELTTVTGSQSNSYAYDNVGNRTTADSISYTANALNQYSAVGSTSLSYDDNGNLTDDDTNLYAYDEQNRLTSFDAPGSTNDATYAYDAFNRRVSKTVNGTTTYYLYDGSMILAEYASNGSLLAEYVNGPQIDEVLNMDRNSNTYYLHYDGLGSVTEVTNSSGSIVENYTYDAFGTPSVTTSSIGNPFRYTGREYDEESGLTFLRNRHLNHPLGRFMQRDPIGYYDHMNLQVYVGNNPVNGTDPYGLFTLQESAQMWWSEFGTDIKVLSSLTATKGALAAAKRAYGWYQGMKSARNAICKIQTPHGTATQSSSQEALNLLSQIKSGKTLYKAGKIPGSETNMSQFFATQNPASTTNYASNYGMAMSMGKNADDLPFILGGTLKEGGSVVTRIAPRVGENVGGALEAVTNPGAVRFQFFHMP